MTGYFDAITLNNIHASKSQRLPLQEVHMGDAKSWHFPFIWIQKGVKAKSLSLNGVHRREHEIPVATVQVTEGSEVEHLVINDISSVNYTDDEMPLLVKDGEVKNLTITNAVDE